MKRKLITIALACLLMFSLTLTVFAASSAFTAVLPAHQGDVEVSTIRKEGNASYFRISLNSSSVDAVCAWTEDSMGRNCADPYKQVRFGMTNVNYTNKPAAGTDVTLNLDNPVYSDSTASAEGSWSPN